MVTIAKVEPAAPAIRVEVPAALALTLFAIDFCSICGEGVPSPHIEIFFKETRQDGRSSMLYEKQKVEANFHSHFSYTYMQCFLRLFNRLTKRSK